MSASKSIPVSASKPSSKPASKPTSKSAPRSASASNPVTSLVPIVRQAPVSKKGAKKKEKFINIDKKSFCVGNTCVNEFQLKKLLDLLI